MPFKKWLTIFFFFFNVVVFIPLLNEKQNWNMDFSTNLKSGSSTSDYYAEVSEAEELD